MPVLGSPLFSPGPSSSRSGYLLTVPEQSTLIYGSGTASSLTEHSLNGDEKFLGNWSAVVT